MLNYSVSIKWSDEDGGFIAIIPELVGLSAFGETREQAASELEIAAEAYLESLREAGEAIPAPEKIEPFSGQTRVRMPKSLHAKLSHSAKNEGVSLNTYIISLLSGQQATKETNEIYKQLSVEIRDQQFILLPKTTDTLLLQAGKKEENDVEPMITESTSFTARRLN